jgi:hypothetical protein
VILRRLDTFAANGAGLDGEPRANLAG